MEEEKTKIQYLLDRAKKLRHEGQSQNAIPLLIDSLTFCREIGFSKGEVQTLGNLGMVYKNLGRFEDAIGYLREAVEQSRKLSLSHELDVSLTNLGSTLSELGRPLDALPIYYEARKLCAENNDLRGLAKCEVFLGNTHLRIGNLEIAEDHYSEAEGIYLQVNDLLNQAHLNSNLGALAHHRGDYETTIKYAKRALDIYREVNYVRGILTALNNLGGALMDLERYDEAIGCLKEAFQLAKEGGLSDFVWRVAGNIAEWHRRQNKPSGALREYKDALSQLDDLRAQLRMRSSRLDFVQQRLSLYADAIFFAIHDAHKPIIAFEFAERARGRVLIEDFAFSLGIKSFELPQEWLEKERFLLNQVKEWQNVDPTIETLNKLNTTQKHLETHWRNAFDKAPEYISMRLGEPLFLHNVKELLELM